MAHGAGNLKPFRVFSCAFCAFLWPLFLKLELLHAGRVEDKKKEQDFKRTGKRKGRRQKEEGGQAGIRYRFRHPPERSAYPIYY
ncbi:MAG: hypothetical protein GY765_19530 [bacterium]|nr:hypothetical protein [bacterium]